MQVLAQQFQREAFGRQVFNNGAMVPFEVAFTQETTIFREFGPLAGNTMRVAYTVAPKIGNLLSRHTVDADARHYLRIGSSGLLATRLRGFKSMGPHPDFLYFGGNSELRGYDYLQFVGQNTVFANAELRFPLIEAALTPIGVIGGIRGVFFAGVGGAWFDGQQTMHTGCSAVGGYTFATRKPEICRPVTGLQINASGTDYLRDAAGNPLVTFGPPRTIDGFRLKDGRASYGLGLETFVLSFPVHFDWSWRTLFNRDWEDVLFAGDGGSTQFRKPRFAVWIGYDF